MSKFDLNIDNYSKLELEEIFDLPNSYTRDILEEKSYGLKDNINNDTNVDNVIKIKTIQFLETAKNILMKDKEPSLAVTTIKDSPAPVPTQIYNPTHPSEYFPGWDNDVKYHKRSIYLNIDSRFRDNYYTSQSSDFHLTLPLKINSVVNMKLAAIEFPSYSIFLS